MEHYRVRQQQVNNMHGEHGIPEVDHSEFYKSFVIVASVVCSGNEFKTRGELVINKGMASHRQNVLLCPHTVCCDSSTTTNSDSPIECESGS
jgi:hypothetical protein